jgi:hypothetical protein
MSHARSIIPVVLSLLLTLLGCNPGPSDSFVSIKSGTATITGAGVLSADASCPRGQQLLGGGYLLDGKVVASTPITVIENYPSSGATWRVSVDSTAAKSTDQIAGTVIIALAYCFTTPNVDLNMRTVTASTTAAPPATTGPDIVIRTAAATATCRAGEVLTGGGFQIQNPALHPGDGYNAYITTEAPAMNAALPGWQVNMVSPNTITTGATAYALCAGSYFAAGSLASLQIPSSFPPVAEPATVFCPANTFTTAGGYSLQNVNPSGSPLVLNYSVYSSYSQNGKEIAPPGKLPRQTKVYEASGWHTDFSGLYQSITVSAYCIPVPKKG